MIMIVMPVIMPVRVLVHQCPVIVKMRVALHSHQNDAGDEEYRRAQVNPIERLAQYEYRKGHTKKWRAGEGDLGPSGSQRLCGGNVEYDTRSVGPDADEKRGDYWERLHGRRCHQEADGEVNHTGNEALPERALTRSDSVYQRGKMVIQSPAQACGEHKATGGQAARTAG